MCKKASLCFLSGWLLFLSEGRAQDADTTKMQRSDTLSVQERPVLENDSSVFSVIGPSAPVAVRKVRKASVDSLKAADDYWYANREPEQKQTAFQQKKQNSKSLFREEWFRSLLWLLVLVSFTGVVLWYLSASNIRLFRRAAKKLTDSDSGEAIPEDIFSLPYESELQKAEAGSNYRLAVRLWYLQTLKELALRNLISFEPGKTNSDYVEQLLRQSRYRDFFRLTRHFEYTWYGQFGLSAEAYALIKSDYSSFLNGLRR